MIIFSSGAWALLGVISVRAINWISQYTSDQKQLTLMTTHIFLFVFLRDQNSQHFNEDLLAVDASAFSFVLCFKAIN